MGRGLETTQSISPKHSNVSDIVAQGAKPRPLVAVGIRRRKVMLVRSERALQLFLI
jgi:hypothetical protein